MARTDISYGSIATDQNQFDRLGHPGRYYASVTVNNTQTDFSGSNYGYGALMKEADATGTITLSGGGTIDIADLTAGTIYEISPLSVDVTNTKDVYVLKRQQ
tara:strand:- start:55 stop:360 length:306 start_codon:yes stop_codon:yes gene_type:complete